MDYFRELQHQIGILLILCLFGIALGKTRLLPDNIGAYLFRFIINVTMPALIISSMAKIHFTAENAAEGVVIVIATLFFLLIAFLIASLMVKCLKLPHSQSMVFKIAAVFGNTSVLGFPLLLTIFGEEIVKHLVFFMMTQDLLYWVGGVYLIANHNAKDMNMNLKNRLQKLINPNTTAYLVGIGLAVCHISEKAANTPIAGELYSLVISALSALGGVTLSIVMIAIGFLMSEKITRFSFQTVRSWKNAFVVVLIKLALMPAMTYFVLYPVRDFIGAQAFFILVIQLAMPCGVFISAMAIQYDQDFHLASDSIFLSTLFSLGTIPVIFSILV